MRVTERVHIVKLLTQCMCDSVKIMSTRRVNIVYSGYHIQGTGYCRGISQGSPTALLQ